MKLLKKIVIITGLLFTINVIAGQVSDSLLFELRNTQKNKDRTLLLNSLSRSFINSNIDSSLYYAKEGLKLADDIDYKLGIAENAASLADYYIMYDSLNKAKLYYSQAGEYFNELDMHFDYAELLMVLGNIYLTQSNYSEALMYYQKSEHICSENDFNTILPHIFNNKGIIYKFLNENDKALDYLKKAYKGFKELDLMDNVANSVSNIASIYLIMSHDSVALSYYQEALQIFKENGNLIDASYIYVDLGNYEFEKENYENALEFYTRGYDEIYNKDIDYLGPKSRAFVVILGSMGRVQSRLGNIDLSIEYLKECLLHAQQNHYNNWIETCTYELSHLYEEKGDYRRSLEYFKLYEQYGDSILNESSIKRITQLEMQFEFDKEIKERELEDARRESAQQRKEFLYLFIIGVGVFTAIIIFLMYVNQRNKTSKIELKRQNLKLEHDKLQQELEHKNKELATNVMYLLSKNEFITTTAEKLTKAKMSFKKENQKIIQDVIRDLLMNSSTDVWKEFEVRFQEVHSDFYNNLNKLFPDLTPNEKKICAFLRLNMSTKDIAAITYQSVRSINMARFRLRKKINLETDDNLISFLSKI